MAFDRVYNITLCESILNYKQEEICFSVLQIYKSDDYNAIAIKCVINLYF